ncbi:MAG TPA: site-specific tyrosine recombinase/integron integrase [Thermoanaerobaculia bacterium]|nr:site-specific tyrosine recombinase/integron integrase [Thermoanaerobaculia bacterium]
MSEMRRRMEVELKLQGCSPRTQGTYIAWVRRFAEHYHRPPERMGKKEVRGFLVYLLEERKLSRSSVVQAFCAIKFFYVHVLHRPFELEDVSFPKRKRALPLVLSEPEVKRLLAAAETLRDQAMVMTLYSAGLRLNELLNLHVKDIDSSKMQIRVRQGKGVKDRNVILSQTLLETLRRYFRQYRPEKWLFYGKTPQQRLDQRVVQKMVRRISQKAGLRPGVTCHTLRHSFATHLLEHGTELPYIQELLGHRSIRTTLLYTRVTPRALKQVTSPLDRLDWKAPELS